PLLRDIERLIKKTIERQVIAGFEPSGDHTARHEPQQPRPGQRPRNAPRRRGASNSPKRKPLRPEHQLGSKPSVRPSNRGPKRRHHEQRATSSTPSERAQQLLLRDQLEHHRRQQEEMHPKERAPKRAKGKRLGAFFALGARKVA